MKKLTCAFPLIIAIGVAAACYLKPVPATHDASKSSASAPSPYVVKRIPSSAVHHNQTGAPNIRIAESTSLNWSGYAVPATAAPFTDVAGSWTVPAVTGTKGGYTYSSIWVGIDGDGTSTVEQIGTEQDWTGKTGSYYAWFEMYPNYAYQITGFSVKPGDCMSAEVKCTAIDAAGNKTFTLILQNLTQRTQPFSTTLTSSAAQLGSAEWVVEAPSSLRGVLPLANFGTASLYGCTANGSPMSSYSNLDPITMAGGSGRKLYTKAVPSAVDSTGEGFTVTWDHQ